MRLTGTFVTSGTVITRGLRLRALKDVPARTHARTQSIWILFLIQDASESENDEPPKKKGKLAEGKGKKGPLGLKHKEKASSKQPLTQVENT